MSSIFAQGARWPAAPKPKRKPRKFKPGKPQRGWSPIPEAISVTLSPRKTRIQTVSGGLPGLGKRR